MRRFFLIGSGVLLLVAIQCGARTGLLVPDHDGSFPDVREEDAREEDVQEEDAIFIDATANCPPEATLVYVTGTGGALYSFWPPAFAFTFIGNLTCTSFPTHMTVDRHGVAWVVASSRLYRASTTDAKCIAVDNWTPQPSGFGDFALTFVGTNNVDTSLYILGVHDVGLFDTKLGTFGVVGIPTVAGTASGDMTSNGDGALYFLHDIGTPVLYQIDPATAQVTASKTVAAPGGGSQALAYYGGLFYVFENNNVSSFDFQASQTTPLGVAPIDVTGAGQSTCVPDSPTDAGAPD